MITLHRWDQSGLGATTKNGCTGKCSFQIPVKNDATISPRCHNVKAVKVSLHTNRSHQMERVSFTLCLQELIDTFCALHVFAWLDASLIVVVKNGSKHYFWLSVFFFCFFFSSSFVVSFAHRTVWSWSGVAAFNTIGKVPAASECSSLHYYYC